MIQYRPVRTTAAGTVAKLVALVIAAAIALGSAPAWAGGVAVYWQPPGAPLGSQVRAAFVEATQALGLRLVDASQPPPAPEESLRTALDAAKIAYARFAFAPALAQLDALERRAEADGGGNLDARALADVFFYRWLCRSELGSADEAWDDSVQAARIDSARVLDAALLPPRAVSAWHRALAEVARAPRASLHVEAQPDARVVIDGAQATGDASLAVGRHFVSVEAVGVERYTGMAEVRVGGSRLEPPWRPLRPPDADALVALAGDGVSRVLIGSLERVTWGWRLVARDISLPDGKVVSETTPIASGAPVRARVEALLRRLAVPAPVVLTTPAPPPRRPLYKRWWLWTAVGGGAAAIALGVSLGVVYGVAPRTGTVSASLKGIR